MGKFETHIKINKMSKQKKKKTKKIEKLNSEFKKAFNTAIIAAFGFLTALAWRDVITEWLSKIEAVSPIHGKIINALIITFLSVLVIVTITKLNSSEK